MLRTNGNWIIGNPQLNQDKLLAEKDAMSSLGSQIRSQVIISSTRQMSELVSSDDNSFTDFREVIQEVITNETIIGAEVITIEKDGVWWAIALKCKEELTKERKDYNDRLYLEAKSYHEKYNNQFKSLIRSSDFSTALRHLIKSYILINSLTFFDKDKLDLLENINNEVALVLDNLSIDGPIETIAVFPYSPSNKDIDLKCEFHHSDNIIKLDGIDIFAEYTKGSVEDFDGWRNNKKSLSVIDGSLTFDTGYINTKSADLEIIIYPDIDYIISNIEEKYQLQDLSYKISSEAKRKLKELIKGKAIFSIKLKNEGKIPTFISVDSLFTHFIPQIQRKINNNLLFKVSNSANDASVIISIKKNTNQINVALSRKNNTGDLVIIDEKFIRGEDGRLPNALSNVDKAYIMIAIGQLLDGIFETNLEFEIGKYKNCDENVSIVIENAKYDTPYEFMYSPGKKRTGSIPVKKGKVNYKIYYNQDKSSAIYDTTFYINSVLDLNDFRYICFEKKKITYSLIFSASILPEKKSQLIWDGNNHDHNINSGGISTKLFGYRHFQHKIIYKKNGYKTFHQTIKPTKEIEYPINVNPVKIRLNTVNNLKYIVLPGRGQIELYKASFLKQMQGYIYQASYLYFIGKTIYHHNQYFNHQDKYDIALMNYNSGLDETQEYYQTLYDEVNQRHNLMSQEKSDFETYGQYLILLVATNLIEVTINNVIF